MPGPWSGARGRAGVDPLQRVTLSGGTEADSTTTGRRAAAGASRGEPAKRLGSTFPAPLPGVRGPPGVVARLPGAPPTGMGFCGPCGPRRGVQAPWLFTWAALHVLRRDRGVVRARRLCTHALAPSIGPVTSRTSPRRQRVGSFLPLAATPVGLRRLLSRATASLRPAPPPPRPRGCVGLGRSASPGVVQRSPLHRDPRRSPLRLRGLLGSRLGSRGVGAGLPRRFRA